MSIEFVVLSPENILFRVAEAALLVSMALLGRVIGLAIGRLF